MFRRRAESLRAEPGRIVAFAARESDAAQTRVSVIIPTRDRAGLLARAVETLFEPSTWTGS